MSSSDEKMDRSRANQLSSEDLAALVVDALLRANLLSQDHVERAVRIAAEEIEVRKVLGDY
jgi:hypothetical protein